MTHVHVWRYDAGTSSREVLRYTCECGARGWAKFGACLEAKRAGLPPPIIAYSPRGAAELVRRFESYAQRGTEEERAKAPAGRLPSLDELDGVGDA